MHDTISCPAATWTQVTDANVTALRVTNVSGHQVWLQGAAGAVAPTTLRGAVPLLPYLTWAADLTVADMFPGISGANRVYVYAEVAAQVSVSHA